MSAHGLGAASEAGILAAEPLEAEAPPARFRRLRYAAWLFLRDPSALLGLVLVTLFLLLALLGPMAVPYPADARGAMHLSQRLLAPSWAHPFGTDEMGADLFSRVVVGTRVSLAVGAAITGIAIAVGVPLGCAAGLLGGAARTVIMRVVDVFLSVPGLVLALAIVATLGPGVANGVLALSLVWWPGYARRMEAKALTIRAEPYVEAARTMGASTAWILLRHVLPNCAGPLVVKASMDVGLAVLAAASLGFVGLGAKPPAPEWGAMIAVGRTYMPDWWWYALSPGVFIFGTVLGFNLLGDGLRDVLDPRGSRG